jgi:hypothetical protein
LRPSLQHILEFRGVFHVDLQEQNHCVLRDVVVCSLFYELPGVLFWVVAEAAAVGDDVYLVPFASLFYEPPYRLVYLYRLLAQLERAPYP